MDNIFRQALEDMLMLLGKNEYFIFGLSTQISSKIPETIFSYL